MAQFPDFFEIKKKQKQQEMSTIHWVFIAFESQERKILLNGLSLWRGYEDL